MWLKGVAGGVAEGGEQEVGRRKTLGDVGHRGA